MAYPEFDDRDQEYLNKCLAAWNEQVGPRVGDFAILKDGRIVRFSHDWGHDIQVSKEKSGSYYLGKGYMSYSGSLYPAIMKDEFILTGDTKQGSAWFFHHNQSQAHNGVYFSVPCRVYRQKEDGSDIWIGDL